MYSVASRWHAVRSVELLNISQYSTLMRPLIRGTQFRVTVGRQQ